MRKLRPESCRVTETTPALACGGGCSEVALGAVVLLGWAPVHRVFFSFCCSMQKQAGPGASAGCPPGEPGPKQCPQIKSSEVIHDPGNRHMPILISFHGPKQEAEKPQVQGHPVQEQQAGLKLKSFGIKLLN